MKNTKIIFLFIFCNLINTSSHSSAARFQKVQELIDSYESPAIYQFFFRIYRDPANKKGLIETIKTCHILCEDLKGKEFNSRVLAKALPKNVGQVNIFKATLRGALFYDQAEGRFKNEQEHLQRYNEQLEKYKQNSCSQKFPTDFEELQNDFTSSILKSLSMKNPEYNAYLMNNKNMPPQGAPNSTVIIDQSRSNSLLPCKVYQRSPHTGELELVESLTALRRSINEFDDEVTTIYIQQLIN
jgi:hypothetical protein